MSYYIHDLRIEGIEVLSVERYSVTGSLGEHTTLVLTAYLAEENVAFQQIKTVHPITVYLDQDKEKKILFTGVITKANVVRSGNVKKVEILAKSFSYLLDIQKRSRSFQDINMNYSVLIREVLKSYENVYEFIAIGDRAIGELIVQYEETDWEFLKRILSTLEITITPAAEFSGIYIYLGIPELKEVEIPYEVLLVEKDFASYYYLKANEQQVYDMDYIKVNIKSPEIVSIFNRISIRQQLFTVKSYRYESSENDFVAFYELQRKSGMKQKRQYPMHLIGVAIKGTVANTQKDKVQVSLDIDKENPRAVLSWFPYSTIVASSDGSGWYCMPEIGDIVRVYFPSKNTSQAIALSAVSDYEAANPAADKMANPSVKYLSNQHNKEVILTPASLQINCNGNSSMTINKNGKVTFFAKNNVRLQAQADIHISAASDITFHALESIVMRSGDGGAGALTEEGHVVFQGTEVLID